MEETLPDHGVAFLASYSPSPWLLLSLASLYLQSKLEAFINIFPVFSLNIPSCLMFAGVRTEGGKPEANQGNALFERQGLHVRTWVKTNEALFYVHTTTL